MVAFCGVPGRRRLGSYPLRGGLCGTVAALLVGVVVFLDEGDAADDVVGDGLAAGELQGGAHGGALPDGGSADGVGGRGLRPGGENLLNDGLARTELGDDGDDAAFGVGGDAAVGGVVAEPDDIGDEGVEVWEVKGGDVAADAVDHEPGAGLPGPADGFGGERVVDAEGAADDEGAVGDVVDFAEGPLTLYAVDDERADAEGRGGVGLGIGGGLRRSVRDLARRAKCDGVNPGRLGRDGDRAGEEQEQGH